ncbi:helix-turn-helix domain-containing protein [Paenibacillus cymbidii]|uniref:helix-turn-helix domain-containing protein n=1 Tax=Paenibacillus cymbidii TaxID=1639034 RepID=UPI0010808AA5|nr:helix-turn-helix domain-containing protein [Paenibacillus cymbidii]
MPEFKRFLHNNRTLFSFVVPYLLILFIPVLFCAVIYFKSMAIIESEIARSDDSILRQVEQSMDSRLRDIERLAITIELDSRIRGLLYVTDDEDPIHSYNKYWLSNEFRTYMLANKFISRFYIYLYQSNSILASNGVHDPEFYYSQNYQFSHISPEEWKTNVLRPAVKGYLPIDDSIVFVKPLVPYASIHPEDAMGTIVFQLDVSEWRHEQTILIVDDQNRLMYTSEPTRFSETIDYGLLRNQEAVKLDYAGREMVAYTVPSQVANWKYVSLVPRELFMQKASAIKRLTVVAFAITLAISGCLVYIFSRHNYRPIHRLLRVITHKSGIARDARASEYKFIEETVTHIVAENKQMEQKVDRQNSSLRDYYLIRLMKGKPDDHLTAADMHDYYRPYFVSDRFAVLLFYMEDIAYERGEDLIFFMTKNTVEDLVRQSHAGYVVEVDQFIVCLVNFDPADSGDAKKELLHIAEQAKRIISSKFGIVFTVSVSSTHRSLEGIKSAYNEAMDAIEYRLIFGSESVIHYDDIQHRKQEHITGNERFRVKERQFANYVRAGDFQGAKQIIHELIGDTAFYAQVPVDIVKCNMFGLINTVITTIGEFNVVLDKSFLTALSPIDRLVNCRTLPQLDKEIRAILDEIEAYASRKEQIHENYLKDNTISFIEENFRNPDLSVSMIADRMQVSLPYLSKFFKQQTGEGLLEYIQKVRMQKAQEHMAKQDLSVKEAAALVGYENTITFTRLFKKYTGITPGKFKGD